jgi:hypothetical protein
MQDRVLPAQSPVDFLEIFLQAALPLTEGGKKCGDWK